MTRSSFATPDTSGVIPVEFADSPPPQSAMIMDSDDDGYAYSIGFITDQGFAAFSGILPTSEVVAPPETGQITYDATFIVRSLVNIRENNGTLVATSGVNDGGPITLLADFSQNTLTGSGGQLVVNGVLSGAGSEGLDGSVEWLGVQGSLAGLVGSDEVVGAFHGSSDSIVYAGGFIGGAQAGTTPP